MTQIKLWTRSHRRSASIVFIAGTLSLGLLLFRLGSLMRGTSNAEFIFQQHYASLGVIAHNPVNLPLLLVHWLVGLWAPLNAFWLRTPSVLFAALTLAAMAYVLRRWYGIRTAILTFALFACSAWLLHVSRSSTTDIMYLFMLPMLYLAHVVIHGHNKSRTALYFWLAIQAMLLYIPGGIWFVLLNAFLQRSEILAAIKCLGSWLNKVGFFLATAILLTPLVTGLLIGSSRTVGLNLLGLPTALPSISETVHRAAEVLLFVAVRGNASDALWLNHLPLLDAFVTVVFLAGAYFYAKHWRASRTKLLFGSLFIGVVLLSLGGPITIGILVAVLFLIAAAGIAYLLHLWLAVFPRNPVARGLGIGLLSVAVAISCLYGVRQYFVAWAHHLPARTSFTQHEIVRPKL